MNAADRPSLNAARDIRRGVRAAVVGLESAAASSIYERGWSEAMAEQLAVLQAAFAHHVAVTESDGGLLDEIREIAPRLDRRIRQICTEHVEIGEAIEAARGDASGVVPSDTEAARTLRDTATDLIVRVTRHRQIGADLVFEAYNVDIEGGG
jgi:hypothetical protein